MYLKSITYMNIFKFDETVSKRTQKKKKKQHLTTPN